MYKLGQLFARSIFRNILIVSLSIIGAGLYLIFTSAFEFPNSISHSIQRNVVPLVIGFILLIFGGHLFLKYRTKE